MRAINRNRHVYFDGTCSSAQKLKSEFSGTPLTPKNPPIKRAARGQEPEQAEIGKPRQRYPETERQKELTSSDILNGVAPELAI